MKHSDLKFVDHSAIYCCNPLSIVSDYNNYIISLLERFIKTTGAAININFVVFGKEFSDFNNENPTIRIECNYEHTLVLPGGRDTEDARQGKIYDEYGKPMDYLVRLVNRESLAKADLVIDYSIQNVLNIFLSGDFKDIDNNMICIYPSLYEEHQLCKSIGPRVLDCITTFFDVTQPRRKKIVDELIGLCVGGKEESSDCEDFKGTNEKMYNYRNINTCFTKNELQQVYLHAKILVNIHQTDHHHTLEELRVLPALQCGVLVICEKCPINENNYFNVKYHEYIIWAEYDNIAKKTEEVFANYEKYFHDIFLTPKQVNLYDFDAQNYQDIEKSLTSILSKFTNAHGVH